MTMTAAARLEQSRKFSDFHDAIQAIIREFGYVPYGSVKPISSALGVPYATARYWLNQQMGVKTTSHGRLDPQHELRMIERAFDRVRERRQG